MKIHEAAQHVGVVTGTLRNWERQGIIPEPDRTALGQRNYSAEDVLAIQKVVRERNQGKKK